MLISASKTGGVGNDQDLAPVANYIWNTSTLMWEKATGSLSGGSSVTVTNLPADPATGTRQDTGNASLASILTEVTLSTAPVITNISVPTAATEVSHALQTNLRRLMVKVRGLAHMQLAFVSTESSTKYITIPGGSMYHEDAIKLSGKTLYFQLNSAPNVVEILEWT